MRSGKIAFLAAVFFALSTAPTFAANNFTVQVGQNSLGQNALAFNPATLLIQPGDTVTFTNNSGGFHNVDSTSGPTAFHCSVDCVSNNGPNGSAWSDTVTFPTAGTVTYRCDQHFDSGMTGSITVQAMPVTLQSFDVN